MTSYEHVYKVIQSISTKQGRWHFLLIFYFLFFLVIMYIKTTFLQVIKRFLIWYESDRTRCDAM